MKGKGKIILCIFSLLLAIVALATSSFAWIVSIKRSGNIVFVTGRVKYTLTGNLNQFDIIVPNKELVNSNNKYILTNESSIDSELRMQIQYQFSNTDKPVNENWIIFTDQCLASNAPDSTNKVIGTITSSDTYSWNYSNGLWYYHNGIDGTIKAKDKISITVLESLYANGNACGNEECSKRNLFIKLDFQAKQKNYVTWDELGRIVASA